MEEKKTAVLLEYADLNDGYVSVESAKGQGIAQTYLSFAEKEGLFTKVSKGLYIKRGYMRDPFYELAFRYRKAVFSLKSCLFLHGVTQEETLEVHLPRNYCTHGIEGVSSRHVGEKEFTLGQSIVVTPRGNFVNGYDLERTMIDLLRNRVRYGKDDFLFLWRACKEKSPYREKLEAYAQAFHVEGELSLLDYLF
ncbi:MAG: type IV toxin-antitoxin system AbiEi family antitoxin domain-containing protein [Bacilli bacterium]|nr:type IV toxin-antitoxin system AbiEi family antitoxin domain-containing protein [Bacilli bacterium]